jgi:adenine-specific DNA methylase
MTRFTDLYTNRQLRAIEAFSSTLASAMRDTALTAVDRAALTVLGLCFGRLLHQNSSCTRWLNKRNTVAGSFGKQALQVTWDFAEIVPTGDAPGSWDNALDWPRKIIAFNQDVAGDGTVEQSLAQQCPLPSDSAALLFTDPPYFAAIPYADLAGFFYVWEQQLFVHLYPELFAERMIDQTQEAIVTDANRGPNGTPKNEEYFRREMTLALGRAREIVNPHGLGVVVFADTRTASWEAILAAVIEGGWVVTASWPIDTEHQNRTQAHGAASLQSSIHLVCRPRENADGSLRKSDVGDWREVLAELPKRIHEWMPRLSEEGIVGADAIFACLGPALEVFSRYSRVEKASGQQVSLRDYLEQVWGAVSQEALRMVFEGADASGFEEDARLTAMWLWTLSTGNGQSAAGGDEGEEEADDEDAGGKKKSGGGYALEFDTARKIAQGLGAHLEALQSVVAVEGETARLLPVAERTKALFGKDEGDAPAGRKKKSQQMKLAFDAELEQAEAAGGWGEKGAPKVGETTLDRVHQSMILFAAGRSEAMRRFLVEEGVGRDGRFWTLAQALSALYPAGTDEKRWVDGVLARKKGLGF